MSVPPERTPARGDVERVFGPVLFASRIFAPESAAAAFRLSAVAKALALQGTSVSVLTTVPAPGGERGRSEAAAVPAVAGVKVSRWPAFRDGSGYVRGYLQYLSFDVPLFFRLLVAKRPEVILVEPPPTTGAVVRVVAALRRVPYVWYAADVWSDATEAAAAPSLVVTALRFVERFAVRGAAGVIAVSEGVAERVALLGGKNISVIPNGIDTEVYSSKAPELTPEELSGWGIRRPYLVYAGTASEWQGASIFAEALAEVAGADEAPQLVYVGMGSEWEKIKSLAAELGLQDGLSRVVQIPPQEPSWVARLLAGSEGALVSMIPGKGYDFAYPTKVLAALASGRPVLYAGAGPVVEDLNTAGLGVAVDYEANAVARGFSELREIAKKVKPETLRAWVVENRSMDQMGRRAAEFIRSCAKPRDSR